MKKLICLFALFLILQSVAAQNNHLSGRVKALESDEPLISANIYYTNNPAVGTITNSDGEFVLKMISGSDSIKVSYMGYQSAVYSVNNVPETIHLKVSPIQLEEVSVYPVQTLVKEIWKKYYQKYQAEEKVSKEEKEKEKNTFFYRQITRTDTVYNEFIECFFTGTNSDGVTDLQLRKGRYARYQKDDLNLTFKNFFSQSQARPFHHANPPKKGIISMFIQPDSEEFFDIAVVGTIDGGKDGNILVFEFTPKEKYRKKLFRSSKTNLKKDDILLKEIGKMKYEPEFWRDNPVIKRTPIEDEIINWFENKDIFGNFNPNEP